MRQEIEKRKECAYRGDETCTVSVCISAYNHESFIRQCIEGVLQQKTDFQFEIIIGEDESNDGTRDICLEYQKEYPDRIRLFLRKRQDAIFINGRPTGRYNFSENLKMARGKYIAICDGDDYWIDLMKLQKQVDLLETNPEIVLCHHDVYKQINADQSFEAMGNGSITKYKRGKLLEGNKIVSSSCLFRRNLFDYFPEWFYNAPYADYALHILNSEHGGIARINSKMAVHRYHDNSVWTSKSLNTKAIQSLEFLLFVKNNIINKTEEKKCIEKNIFSHHYRIAYTSSTKSETFLSSYEYCRNNKMNNFKFFKMYLFLLLYKLGVLEYDIQKERLTIFRSHKSRKNNSTNH